MATRIGINDTLSKILIQILVLILNLFFSKLFVFTKNQVFEMVIYLDLIRTI